VLIDADNTSPQIAGGLFEEVAKFGEASVRRIYGDFSGPQLKSWSDILQKHAIDPYQQFAYTKARTLPTFALVIDAMDLLHSGRFDGFCLVSSDSDFTRWPRACASRAPTSMVRCTENAGEFPAGMPPLHLHGKPVAGGCNVQRQHQRRNQNRCSHPALRFRSWKRRFRKSRARMAG